MQDHPVLAQVALGYSPMIDRRRAVTATRLTVFPERGAPTPDAAALLAALAEVWPAEPAQAASVLLNVADEALLLAVLALAPCRPWTVEVPAFMIGTQLQTPQLQQLQATGTRMAIKGRPLGVLSVEVLGCFASTIVEAGDDRRLAPRPAAGSRSLEALQSGIRSSADIEAAFVSGAVAVLGWPFDDPLPPPGGRAGPAAGVQVVLDLIQGVDREDPVPRLEAVLKRDPTLAFRLLRLLNSPAFGLTVEIQSFGQALMLLGSQRLKRWLALLLATSGNASNAKPLVAAAVRRGLVLEELARGRGDASMRGEMFICGVFSLLDRLLGQPLPELLGQLSVPDTVQQALRGEGGPYLPYLQLVQAIEQESAFDIRESADRLLLGAAELNRAVLAALQAARQLEG